MKAEEIHPTFIHQEQSPPQFSSLTSIGQTPVLSSHYNEYTQFMGNPSHFVGQKYQKMLSAAKIKYSENSFYPSLEIIVKKIKNDSKSILLQVKLSYFSLQIMIYCHHKNSQTPKQLSLIGRGSYGSIYYFKTKEISYAIKHLTTLGKEGQKLMNEIRNSIREYCVNKIAYCLQIGPKIGFWQFDLIIYKDSIQFALEYCLQRPQLLAPESLKEDLKILHSVKLIHGDIKQENVLFSPCLNKLVFIDFNCSIAIEECLGECSLSQFRGTLSFCSPEMKQLISSKSKAYIDLYYNDLYSLLLLTPKIQIFDQVLSEGHPSFSFFCFHEHLRLRSCFFNRDIQKMKRYLNLYENELKINNSFREKIQKSVQLHLQIEEKLKLMRKEIFQIINNTIQFFKEVSLDRNTILMRKQIQTYFKEYIDQYHQETEIILPALQFQKINTFKQNKIKQLNQNRFIYYILPNFRGDDSYISPKCLLACMKSEKNDEKLLKSLYYQLIYLNDLNEEDVKIALQIMEESLGIIFKQEKTILKMLEMDEYFGEGKMREIQRRQIKQTVLYPLDRLSQNRLRGYLQKHKGMHSQNYIEAIQEIIRIVNGMIDDCPENFNEIMFKLSKFLADKAENTEDLKEFQLIFWLISEMIVQMRQNHIPSLISTSFTSSQLAAQFGIEESAYKILIQSKLFSYKVGIKDIFEFIGHRIGIHYIYFEEIELLNILYHFKSAKKADESLLTKMQRIQKFSVSKFFPLVSLLKLMHESIRYSGKFLIQTQNPEISKIIDYIWNQGKKLFCQQIQSTQIYNGYTLLYFAFNKKFFEFSTYFGQGTSEQSQVFQKWMYLHYSEEKHPRKFIQFFICVSGYFKKNKQIKRAADFLKRGMQLLVRFPQQHFHAVHLELLQEFSMVNHDFDSFKSCKQLEALIDQFVENKITDLSFLEIFLRYYFRIRNFKKMINTLDRYFRSIKSILNPCIQMFINIILLNYTADFILQDLQGKMSMVLSLSQTIAKYPYQYSPHMVIPVFSCLLYLFSSQEQNSFIHLPAFQKSISLAMTGLLLFVYKNTQLCSVYIKRHIRRNIFEVQKNLRDGSEERRRSYFNGVENKELYENFLRLSQQNASTFEQKQTYLKFRSKLQSCLKNKKAKLALSDFRIALNYNGGESEMRKLVKKKLVKKQLVREIVLRKLSLFLVNKSLRVSISQIEWIEKPYVIILQKYLNNDL